ncbi:MAG: hypothetical protein GF398_18155 [Chitinivibrionales bacterium]|nr:hypothetical protein [Chitinivibrionales bacterium]
MICFRFNQYFSVRNCLAVVILLAHLAPLTLANDNLSLSCGLKLSKNFYLQPGIVVDASYKKLLNGHPFAELAWSTSRFQALAQNTLKNDNVLLSLGWDFRPENIIGPYAKVDIGFARYDIEYEEIFGELDNAGMILSALIGSKCTFYHDLITVYGDCGYSFIHSSTVYPFFATVGATFDIYRGIIAR